MGLFDSSILKITTQIESNLKGDLDVYESFILNSTIDIESSTYVLSFG